MVHLTARGLDQIYNPETPPRTCTSARGKHPRICRFQSHSMMSAVLADQMLRVAKVRWSVGRHSKCALRPGREIGD